MKRNLSKNFIKSLTIALSLTLGSTAAISTAMVSNQVIEVSAMSLQGGSIENNQFEIKSNANVPTDLAGKYIFVTRQVNNEDIDYLFKVITTAAAEETTASGAIAGKATLIGIVGTELTGSIGDADGSKIPLKGTLQDNTLKVSDLKNSGTQANDSDKTQVRLIVDKIGVTNEPLKYFDVDKNNALSNAANSKPIPQITSRIINNILTISSAANKVEVSNKAFKDIIIDSTITDANGDKQDYPIVVGENVKLKDYVFDTGTKKTEDNNFSIDLVAFPRFTDGTEITSNTFKSDGVLVANDKNKIKVILQNKSAISSFNTIADLSANKNLTAVNQSALRDEEFVFELPKGPKDNTVTISLTGGLLFDSTSVSTSQNEFKLKKGSNTYVANAASEDNGKIKLTFNAADIETLVNEDDIQIIYEENSTRPIKTTAVSGVTRELSSFAIDKKLNFEAPAKLSTAIVDVAGGLDKFKKLELTFEKAFVNGLKLNPDTKKDFKILEVKGDTETDVPVDSTDLDVAAGKLTLKVSDANKFKIGHKYKVSYKADATRAIKDVNGNTLTSFENIEVENKAGEIGDEFTTSGYKFKLLTNLQANDISVQLMGINATPDNYDATLLNGEVQFENGMKAVISEIGDGTNPITTKISKEELVKITSKATKIKSKALQDLKVELPKSNNQSTLILPLVKDVEVNGLAIGSGIETVQLLWTALNPANVVNDSFKTSTAGKNTSVTTVKIPNSTAGFTAANLGVKNVIVMAAIPQVDNQDIANKDEVFLIKTIDTIGDDDESIGDITLKSLGNGNGNADITLKDGIVTYKLDTTTANVKSEFLYYLSQLGDGNNAIAVNEDTFKETGKLNQKNLQYVTNLSASVFEGQLLPKELTFEAVENIADNAFKDTKGLETLVLKSKDLVANQIVADAFKGSSVKTIKVNLDKNGVNDLKAILNASQNQNVKDIKVESSQDIYGPTVEIAVVNNNAKNVVEITFNENVELFEEGKLPANGDFEVTVGTKRNEVTRIEIKEKVVKLTLKDNFSEKDIIKVKYTQGVNKISDNLKNAVEDFNVTAHNKITSTTQSGGSGGSSNSGSTSGGGGSIDINSSTTQPTPQNITNPTTPNTTQNNNNVVKRDLTPDVIKLPQLSEEAKEFSDIQENHWAKSSIEKLSKAGIISGDADGKFNANGKTKRADVTIMLVKLLGLEGEPQSNFSDVDNSKYYAKYVGLAKEYGIINGSNGKFNPESSISRQDTMVMVAQILKGLNFDVNTETKNLEKFSDLSNFSGYAKESAAILVNSGILNGSNGKLNPKAPVTRAEMSTIIAKIYDMLESTTALNNEAKVVEDITK